MISVSSPDIGPAELAAVTEAVRSGWLSHGPFVERLEALWAERCETRYALATSNGSTALQLALEALGLPDGAEVLVPTATYCATASAVIHARLRPVFVGCLEFGDMDLDAARRAMTQRTQAAVIVHLYGKPDPAALASLFTPLRVVEDCAEAHGATHEQGTVVGSQSDAASWSFYGNKIVACGEGGAVTTHSRRLAQTARLLRGQGVDPARRFVAVAPGHNMRLGNVAAAIACAQIERMPTMLQQRHRVAAWYREELGGMIYDAGRTGAVTWLVNARVGDGPAVAQRMQERGVESRPWFPPLHSMPAFAGYDYVGDETAERLHREVISLPTSSTMDRQTVAAVCAALKESL